jgi:hypothetical protein
MAVDPLASVAGGLLLFALPGLAWTRALFPEWRIAGSLAITRAVETATLGFVMSLGLTILVGFSLTFGPTGPFPSGWTNPELEEILAAIAAVGFGVALLRGGFARVPPPSPRPEPAEGADAPTPMLEEIATLRTEERRVRHRLRRGGLGPEERSRLEGELDHLRRRAEELRRGREEQYAR